MTASSVAEPIATAFQGPPKKKSDLNPSKPLNQMGFKHTTKQYEPDLSDEALENMVPPPKRRIGEDTPLVDMSQQQNQEYSLANYTG